MPSAPPSPEARSLAETRLHAMRTRLRRVRRRALAAAGASFILALAAVTYQQQADERAAAQAAPAAAQATDGTMTSDESALEAPTTQVS